MNNLIYLNQDPILMELNSSVDKNSAKKMLAFKFFNGDVCRLEKYLKDNSNEISDAPYNCNFIEPKSQLEFTF
tara:strand:- start:134 stop:352 length:219 start_codon:yes stop_codon:yes gene_type:complete